MNGFASLPCPIYLLFAGHLLTTMLQNTAILKNGGQSEKLIDTLLEASGRWTLFRAHLRNHVSVSKELQKRFETDPAFYHEVSEHEGISQTKQLPQPKIRSRAILQLEYEIGEMSEECEGKILDLQKRTTEMIEMVSVWSLATICDLDYSAHDIAHHAGVQPRLDL